MIKWLKNLLNLNGFSKGGFTGRGEIVDDSQTLILPTDCRLPILPQPEYRLTWPGKDQGRPQPPIMWLTGGYVSSPPPDDGLVLAVLSPGTKDAI